MSVAGMWLAAVLIVVAFAGGMWQADWMCRRMWRDDGYCPICDRLTTEEETS